MRVLAFMICSIITSSTAIGLTMKPEVDHLDALSNEELLQRAQEEPRLAYPILRMLRSRQSSAEWMGAAERLMHQGVVRNGASLADQVYRVISMETDPAVARQFRTDPGVRRNLVAARLPQFLANGLLWAPTQNLPIDAAVDQLRFVDYTESVDMPLDALATMTRFADYEFLKLMATDANPLVSLTALVGLPEAMDSNEMLALLYYHASTRFDIKYVRRTGCIGHVQTRRSGALAWLILSDYLTVDQERAFLASIDDPVLVTDMLTLGQQFGTELSAFREEMLQRLSRPQPLDAEPIEDLLSQTQHRSISRWALLAALASIRNEQDLPLLIKEVTAPDHEALWRTLSYWDHPLVVDAAWSWWFGGGSEPNDASRDNLYYFLRTLDSEDAQALLTIVSEEMR